MCYLGFTESFLILKEIDKLKLIEETINDLDGNIDNPY
jgi:hypothetical protein